MEEFVNINRNFNKTVILVTHAREVVEYANLQSYIKFRI